MKLYRLTIVTIFALLIVSSWPSAANADCPDPPAVCFCNQLDGSIAVHANVTARGEETVTLAVLEAFSAGSGLAAGAEVLANRGDYDCVVDTAVGDEVFAALRPLTLTSCQSFYDCVAACSPQSDEASCELACRLSEQAACGRPAAEPVARAALFAWTDGDVLLATGERAPVERVTARDWQGCVEALGFEPSRVSCNDTPRERKGTAASCSTVAWSGTGSPLAWSLAFTIACLRIPLRIRSKRRGRAGRGERRRH